MFYYLILKLISINSYITYSQIVFILGEDIFKVNV